jgi:hypothetical protein
MMMSSDGQVQGLRLKRLVVDERAGTLVGDLLGRACNVLLTPTWIAHALKAHSQKMFMEVERNTLWPMVRQMMADLLDALIDDDARTWAGTALALLNEEQGEGAVAERVAKVSRDPASTPRGHYEEGMHGYFRGLQFLIKSVFDVRLNPRWCKPIPHFIFPWSALGPIWEALRSHPGLSQRWADLHHFYTVATGEPDCVCIHHLLDLPAVQPDTVLALADELGVPKINRKMGIGVQGLAERFTRHGVIFEYLKETFLPDIIPVPIPRESVYAVVNMHSLLFGFEHHGGRIPMLLDGRVSGLLKALAAVREQKMAAFFDQFLMAQYELVSDLPVPDVVALVPDHDPAVEQLAPSLRRRLNAFAANLTGLLELSILSAKQPMKVVTKSVLFEPPPRQVRVYVETVPRRFFDGLGQAGQAVTGLCQQMTEKHGPRHPSASFHRLVSVDPVAVYTVLANLSERGQFLLRDSPEWQAALPLVGNLARNPNVTADAYRHWDQDPKERYFLQWCTAMASFEAQVADGTPVHGGELLFVEGWNDAIVPGRREPLTNSIWRVALATGSLKDLRGWSIAPGL